jgi:hypothetical protein
LVHSPAPNNQTRGLFHQSFRLAANQDLLARKQDQMINAAPLPASAATMMQLND